MSDVNDNNHLFSNLPDEEATQYAVPQNSAQKSSGPSNLSTCVAAITIPKCSSAFRASTFNFFPYSPTPKDSILEVGLVLIGTMPVSAIAADSDLAISDTYGNLVDDQGCVNFGGFLKVTNRYGLRGCFVVSSDTQILIEEQSCFLAGGIKVISGIPEQCQDGFMLENARIFDVRGKIDADINAFLLEEKLQKDFIQAVLSKTQIVLKDSDKGTNQVGCQTGISGDKAIDLHDEAMTQGNPAFLYSIEGSEEYSIAQNQLNNKLCWPETTPAAVDEEDKLMERHLLLTGVLVEILDCHNMGSSMGSQAQGLVQELICILFLEFIFLWHDEEENDNNMPCGVHVGILVNSQENDRLYDGIDETLKMCHPETTLAKISGGFFAQQVICHRGPQKEKREEPSAVITVDVKNKKPEAWSLGDTVILGVRVVAVRVYFVLTELIGSVLLFSSASALFPPMPCGVADHHAHLTRYCMLCSQLDWVI
eukprot:Gb_30075 [translate_table: standard]